MDGEDERKEDNSAAGEEEKSCLDRLKSCLCFCRGADTKGKIDTFKASIPNNLSFQMRLRRPCQWRERMRGRRRRPISATLRSAVMFFFEMKM